MLEQKVHRVDPLRAAIAFQTLALLAETNNDLSESEGYEHISVVQPLSLIDGSSFRSILPSKILSEPKPGDILSAAVVALELLRSAEKPLTGRMPPKEMIIISDGKATVDDSPDAIESIAEQLRGNKISTTLM